MTFLLLVPVLLAGCATGPSAGSGADDRFAWDYASSLSDPKADALYHFSRAQLLLADGDYQSAATALKEAVAADPDSEELRFTLAEVYLELDQPEQAKRIIEDLLINNPDSVEAHLALGNAYFSNKDSARAVSHFRRVLELDPERHQVQLHLAIALVRAGELDQAVDEFKDLINKDPGMVTARLALARLYREMDLGILAEEQYRYLIEQNPDLTQAYIELGLLYEERKEWKAAMSIFRKALDGQPLNFALRHHIARVLVGMKRYDEALDELSLIVELNPDDFDARRKVGLIYLEQERWDDAIKVFHEILEVKPDADPVRYYLGSTLERLEFWDAALEAFLGIDRESSLFDDAVAHIGYIYLELGRIDDAILLLQERVENGEPRPQVFYYLISLHLTKDQLGQAMDYSDQAVALFPDNQDLLYQRGLVLERNGRHDEAMSVMRDVLRVAPENAEALNFLAYAYAEENTNLDEALSMARQAIALRPEAHIQDTLGWIFFRLGRFEDALNLIAAASRELTDDEVVLDHLAQVHQALGDLDKAREIYRRILELNPDNQAVRDKLDDLASKP